MNAGFHSTPATENLNVIKGGRTTHKEAQNLGYIFFLRNGGFEFEWLLGLFRTSGLCPISEVTMEG